MAYDTAAEIKLKPGQWCDVVQALLLKAEPGDGRAQHSLERLRQGVESGEYTLLIATFNQEIIGAAVLRVAERLDGCFEGVIESAAGDVRGVPLLKLCLPEIENYFRGVDFVRYHTQKPGVVRMMVSEGYTEELEFIARKRVGKNG